MAFAKDPEVNLSSGGQTVRVLVYDYAAVSGSTLREAENLSARLLARAGVPTEWVHCRAHQFDPQTPPCGAGLEEGYIVIRILPKHPGQPGPLGDPLGSAAIASRFASLYLSEIRISADRGGIQASVLIGYAATHEIGHLLLGPKHSKSGIMQAVWRKNEYREMPQCWLRFSVAERAALRLSVQTQVGLGANVK